MDYKDTNAIIDILEKSIYFRQVHRNELEDIAKIMELVHYNKGDIIFRENDTGEDFYIIVDGKVEISIRNVNDGKKILAVKGQYEGFGELAIIDKQERSATVECLEDSTLLKLSHSNFEYLINKNKSFSHSLAYVLTNIVRYNKQILIKELVDKNEILEKSVNQLQDLQEVIIKNERLIAVGRFANRMIHDLKNMLNLIYNAIQLISRKNLIEDNENKKELNNYLNIVLNTVTQMNEMCMEVMGFSEGNVKLEKELVPFSAFIRESINKIKETLDYKDIKIIENLNAKAYALIDKRKMNRVLTNIVFNAVDALSEVENPVIEINTYNNGDYAVVEIKDNGKGIAKENMDMIFDPFFSSGKPHGTGLGLAISKEVVTMHHGGKLFVESEINEGTSFIIQLPIKK
ncbi:MAG: ATP-binding protein [Spirochaetota bacterium]